MDYQSMLISFAIFAGIFIIYKLVGRFLSKPKAKPQTISVRIQEKESTEEVDEKGLSIRYVTFYIPVSKEQIRLQVSRRVFREIPNSGNGTLTYAGNEFIKLEINGLTIEK